MLLGRKTTANKQTIKPWINLLLVVSFKTCVLVNITAIYVTWLHTLHYKYNVIVKELVYYVSDSFHLTTN